MYEHSLFMMILGNKNKRDWVVMQRERGRGKISPLENGSCLGKWVFFFFFNLIDGRSMQLTTGSYPSSNFGMKAFGPLGCSSYNSQLTIDFVCV